MKQTRVLIAVAALALSGCANTFHDSYLVGERWYQARIDTYPVILLSVDGSDTLQRRVRVAAGEHVIRVQGPSAAGMQGEARELRLMVEPCNTYYLVAVKPNALARDFSPAVDHKEALGGCTPPPGWKQP